MRYQQDLQVGLRDRFRRLMTTTWSSAGHEVSLVADWIEARPALLAILAEAETVEPDLDFEAFLARLHAPGAFAWTSRTEAGRAVLVWNLMKRMAADLAGGAEPDRIGVTYSSGVTRGTNNLNDSWREFTEQILQPLFNYLSEHVGAESSVLYILERYVRRVEWFDRDHLYARATADSGKTEEVYDEDLRKFLFSEGVNMPFAQARSASGESDVLSELDSDDPLVLEVKVFDGINRKKRVIASGLHQAVHYALDYNKPVAYLVVVNLSGHPISFPTESDTETWPPHLTISGVRVNLVAVRALPTSSASKQGKAAPVTVTRENLIDPDGSDG